eukprot:CAMPEP_0176030680 /NCGR_PEP_ID=MMETSP0120_2-20121206/15102_1 /TAXON_ID=160619 /ORGANISM="Kryptoperidinium foliaceum, Strain CCMP 1326" /LENGTH=106 /DNA_ID=CAMNT_0017363937 /DNA_START=157 /DNA_END=474 /DNA_ORIENTATION=+
MATASGSSGHMASQGSLFKRSSHSRFSRASRSASSKTRFASSMAACAFSASMPEAPPMAPIWVTERGANSMTLPATASSGTCTATISPEAKATCIVDPDTAPSGIV